MVVMLPPPDSALAAHINYRGLPTPQQPDTPPKPQIRPRAADQPKPAMSGVLDTVIGAYHQLWHVEKSFRMSKARPASPTDLPPPARTHRRAPEHRVRRAGRVPLDREANRLEHQKIRPNHPALPHHPDQGRQAHHH